MAGLSKSIRELKSILYGSAFYDLLVLLSHICEEQDFFYLMCKIIKFMIQLAHLDLTSFIFLLFFS
jgi:hypothetical protein